LQPSQRESFRKQIHPAGWYQGASLVAPIKLAATRAGANALFTKDGSLDPAAAWKLNAFCAKHSGVDQVGQWKALRDMTFMAV
jgi:hypothetical protein